MFLSVVMIILFHGSGSSKEVAAELAGDTHIFSATLCAQQFASNVINMSKVCSTQPLVDIVQGRHINQLYLKPSKSQMGFWIWSLQGVPLKGKSHQKAVFLWSDKQLSSRNHRLALLPRCNVWASSTCHLSYGFTILVHPLSDAAFRAQSSSPCFFFIQPVVGS